METENTKDPLSIYKAVKLMVENDYGLSDINKDNIDPAMIILNSTNWIYKYKRLMETQHAKCYSRVIGRNKHDEIASSKYKEKYNNDLLTLQQRKTLDTVARRIIDKHTLGSVIPFHPPVTGYSVKQLMLRDYSLFDLKLPGLKIRCYSDKGINKLKGLIHLYDLQIERLYNEEIKKGNVVTPHLFYVDYERRRKIVEENKEVIAHNFIDASDEFVFGTPTEKQIQNILCSTKSENITEDSVAFDFINMITNYSTLDELLENPENPPAISRLVKK